MPKTIAGSAAPPMLRFREGVANFSPTLHLGGGFAAGEPRGPGELSSSSLDHKGFPGLLVEPASAFLAKGGAASRAGQRFLRELREGGREGRLVTDAMAG